MVGGGTKDKFLSELTADALGIEVSSGPVEATSYGNIAIQLMADGEIADIETARKIIAASEKLYTFTPKNASEWNRYYEIYRKEQNVNFPNRNEDMRELLKIQNRNRA